MFEGKIGKTANIIGKQKEHQCECTVQLNDCDKQEN